ncbi:MAG: PQQ-binding-like beta-propeller repeat protein [Pirellulales bacterium]
MKRFDIAILTCLLISNVALADNWPNWRGPTLNGVAAGKDFPTTWSAASNVKWKVDLAGKGSSTPVVWDQRIFLTYGVEGQNTVAALDRQGKLVWQTVIGRERLGKNKKATGANPSAVTDGQHVYAYFKSGDLACLDHAGKIVWQHNLQSMYGEDTLWWDLGTSPVLTKEHVVIAVMQTGPSYLVAFDRSTGKLAWKQDRNLGAPSEAAQSYTTPVVVQEGDRELLVVLGADHVTAHDAADGKEVWRVGGLNPTEQKFFRSISSPVVADHLVVAPYARGATITAIRLGGSGDVTKTHVAWPRTGLGADVPTPAASEGRAYVCTDKGEVACLEIQSGKTLWSGQVEKNRHAYSSSPILAGGKIYITREDGVTFVLAQGDEFKVLASNELDGELVVATPVFADGQILIRTLSGLYCIGE